uniref:Uncharacterized protein n=1 Tax=Graphocephala atropunctata TaxID=36148 RepID=A0A1B6LL26_9HEMI
MFTISEDCSVINMWKINTAAVDEFYIQGGFGLDPFLSLLEGGKGGWQERDLREFFHFGQFIHQGERPDTIRTLSMSLQVCEMINIFQALGFFPTKYQIDNILYEVLGADLSRKHQAETKIKYDELVKLYLNHRPCREFTMSELHQAFQDLYEGAYFSDRDPSQLKLDIDPIFNPESLVTKLVSNGEKTTILELYNSLSTLMGNKLEMQQEEFTEVPPLPFMPKEILFETFFTTVLGFKNENYF